MPCLSPKSLAWSAFLVLPFALAACSGTADSPAVPGGGGGDSGGGDAAAPPDAQDDSTDGSADEAPGDVAQLCPSDLMAAEGAACSLESQVCGTCPPNPCEFCNLIRCTNGVWTWVEAFPDPACDAGGDALSTGQACGSETCGTDEYCYRTGCGVDGCSPPPPECRTIPLGCSSCDCIKPYPYCLCDQTSEGFTVDCPAG